MSVKAPPDPRPGWMSPTTTHTCALPDPMTYPVGKLWYCLEHGCGWRWEIMSTKVRHWFRR